MSVQKEDATNSITYPYQSGITTFDIPFLVKSKDSIKVYLGNTLLPSSGYIYPNKSGDIELTDEGKKEYNNARAAIKISREVPITQLENFSSQASYGSASERGLDKLTLIAQDADLRIEGIENKINTWSYDKVVKIGIDEQIISGEPNLVLPKDRQRKILAFDDKGSVAPKSLGGGLEINTETVDIKLNGKTLSKNSYGIRGNYQGGNGVTITENTISAKSGSSTIIADSEGIKGNYRGGNGVTVTENTISAKPGNSTIIADPEGIKGNYQAGDGVTISGNSIKAKVDGKQVFIDVAGRLSSDAVRKQDISTGLLYTEEGKLQTVLQGIDEHSLNYSFDNKILCGEQSGELNLKTNTYTFNPDPGSYFNVLDEEQQIYAFLSYSTDEKSSLISIRKYNSESRTWTDLTSITFTDSSNTPPYQIVPNIFRVLPERSEILFCAVNRRVANNFVYPNYITTGNCIYNQIKLIRLNNSNGTYSCTEVSSFSHTVPIDTHKNINTNWGYFNFVNMNTGNILGYFDGGYVILANATVERIDDAISNTYVWGTGKQQIHVFKINPNLTLTKNTIGTYNALNLLFNDPSALDRYVRFISSSNTITTIIDKVSAGTTEYPSRARFCIFHPDSGLLSDNTSVAENFSYPPTHFFTPCSIAHRENTWIFYQAVASNTETLKSNSLYYFRITAHGSITQDAFIINGVPTLPLQIFTRGDRLIIVYSKHIVLFEYNIDYEQYTQKYILTIPDTQTLLYSNSIRDEVGYTSRIGYGSTSSYTFNVSDYTIVTTYYTFMPSDREKFDTIEEGAEVNVQSDWNVTDTNSDAFIKNKPAITSQVNSDWNATNGISRILNKPTLATVATSGNYNDLSNKLTAGSNVSISGSNVVSATDTTYSDATTSVAGLMSTADKRKLDSIATGAEVNVQSDWNVTDTNSDAFIKNKPAIPASQVNSDWNATDGVSRILNKPTLATVATSGNYADLNNKIQVDNTLNLVNNTMSMKIADTTLSVSSEGIRANYIAGANIHIDKNIISADTGANIYNAGSGLSKTIEDDGSITFSALTAKSGFGFGENFLDAVEIVNGDIGSTTPVGCAYINGIYMFVSSRKVAYSKSLMDAPTVRVLPWYVTFFRKWGDYFVIGVSSEQCIFITKNPEEGWKKIIVPFAYKSMIAYDTYMDYGNNNYVWGYGRMVAYSTDPASGLTYRNDLTTSLSGIRYLPQQDYWWFFLSGRAAVWRASSPSASYSESTLYSADTQTFRDIAYITSGDGKSAYCIIGDSRVAFCNSASPGSFVKSTLNSTYDRFVNVNGINYISRGSNLYTVDTLSSTFTTATVISSSLSNPQTTIGNSRAYIDDGSFLGFGVPSNSANYYGNFFFNKQSNQQIYFSKKIFPFSSKGITFNPSLTYYPGDIKYLKNKWYVCYARMVWESDFAEGPFNLKLDLNALGIEYDAKYISYENSIWFLSCASGHLYYFADIDNPVINEAEFSSATSSTFTPNAVVYLNGYYITSKSTAIYYTTDPSISWSYKASGLNTTLKGVTFWNGYWCFVAGYSSSASYSAGYLSDWSSNLTKVTWEIPSLPSSVSYSSPMMWDGEYYYYLQSYSGTYSYIFYSPSLDTPFKWVQVDDSFGDIITHYPQGNNKYLYFHNRSGKLFVMTSYNNYIKYDCDYVPTRFAIDKDLDIEGARIITINSSGTNAKVFQMVKSYNV